MYNIAHQTDWKTEPMPNEIDNLHFHRIFSSEEFERVRLGLIPREMEDKWFIYYENHILNIHRSWTGFHIYKIIIQPQEDNTYVVTQTIVNRNKAQYNHQNNAYDVAFLIYLIDRLLLGKDVPFPMPTNITEENNAIYKHSMVGYATPNTTNIAENEPVQINAGDRLGGCLAGGAIGDAIGSYYEGQSNIERINAEMVHGITDDTQLTMATCESIIESGQVSAASIAHYMLTWYNKGKLTGLGASTLKALRDLQVGAHWALAGRSGEYAAGNGAAMRIAPLAFFINPETDRTLIRDVCSITHKNDEAYVGSLAVLYSLHYIITNKWLPGMSLLELITPQLPDTAVRDNLLKLQANSSIGIREAAGLVGTSGHVIESVPFSIFAAGKIRESSFEEVLAEIIFCGGDTDTNASLAGQIMGAFIGLSNFSRSASGMFANIKECTYIFDTATKLSKMLKKQ
jgi:ADP-ribosyl-[dinitrogen reductase] hydrolase